MRSYIKVMLKRLRDGFFNADIRPLVGSALPLRQKKEKREMQTDIKPNRQHDISVLKINVYMILCDLSYIHTSMSRKHQLNLTNTPAYEYKKIQSIIMNNNPKQVLIEAWAYNMAQKDTISLNRGLCRFCALLILYMVVVGSKLARNANVAVLLV